MRIFSNIALGKQRTVEVEEEVIIPIQVNGKLRTKLDVPADIAQDKLKELVLSDEKLLPWIGDKPIRNFVVVPKKLVNIVI